MKDGNFESLTDLLETVEEHAKHSDGIAIETIQEIAGRAAFGPLILIPGLVAVTPLSGIPTVPSILGIIVAIVAAQLAIGRKSVWLPRRLTKVRLDCERTLRGIGFMKKPAGWIDKVVRPRLAFAEGRLARRGAGLVCLLVALTMPPLEILPFVASTAGVILTIFGLAITLRDGLLMIIGLTIFLGGGGAVLYYFLGA